MSENERANDADGAAPAGETAISAPAATGGWMVWAGVAFGMLWAAGAGAFIIGFHGADEVLRSSPGWLGGLAFVVFGPALAFALLGAIARELTKFARIAKGVEDAAKRLSTPVTTARDAAHSLAEAISHQIEMLNRAAEGSLARLAAMEEVLRHHAESVQAASGEARKEVDQLIENLGAERGAISELADVLRTEASSLSMTIDKQAEMVAAAADLAASHAEESRSLLQKTSDGLATAGASAQQAGEKVAMSIGEQLRDMEALVATLDKRSERLESVARVHGENVKIAQATAQELTVAAESGADAMRQAVDVALEQSRRLTGFIEEETQKAADAGSIQIERVRQAAESARVAASEAGRALDSDVKALMERIENLNSTSMDVATRTNDAFETRIKAVEQAISEVDDRIAELPRTAESRARQLNRALEDGLSALERAATRPRAPAGEPAVAGFRDAPDAGWSEDYPPRVERGFERAPERAADRGGEARRPAPRLDEDDRWRKERRSGDYGDDPRLEGFDRGRRASPPPEERGGPQRRPARRDNGRRGRDDEFDLPEDKPARREAESRGRRRRGGNGRAEEPPRGGEEGGWRWKDLLKTMDDEPPGRMIGDAVVSGLRRAGVDPGRALDPDMTSRIARARRRAGAGEARALVLDGALSEVRRTAAALAADPALRQRAETFMDEHARSVRRTIEDNDAAGLSGLLDSDVGRAYLLVDAALAEV